MTETLTAPRRPRITWRLARVVETRAASQLDAAQRSAADAIRPFHAERR